MTTTLKHISEEFRVAGSSVRLIFPVENEEPGRRDWCIATAWRNPDRTGEGDAFIVQRHDGAVAAVDAEWFTARNLPVPDLPEVTPDDAAQVAAAAAAQPSVKTIMMLRNAALRLHNQAESLQFKATQRPDQSYLTGYVKLRRRAELLCAVLHGQHFPTNPSVGLSGPSGFQVVEENYIEALNLDPSILGQSVEVCGIFSSDMLTSYLHYSRQNPISVEDVGLADVRHWTIQAMHIAADLLHQIPDPPDVGDLVQVGQEQVEIVMLPDCQPDLVFHDRLTCVTTGPEAVTVTADADGWVVTPPPAFSPQKR